MKKLLMFLMTLMFVACSAEMTGEDVGERQEAVITPCTINGITGSSTFGVTVITKIQIVPPGPNNALQMLAVTACPTSGAACTTSTHTFADVHWEPAHTVNGTIWQGSLAYPLRRVKMSAPGCMLSSPTKYCMDMQGDYDFGDHINLLQNAERFLFDRPVNVADIEAPVGGAIVQFYGTGWNSWRMKYTNASQTGLSTKYWDFTTPGCE